MLENQERLLGESLGLSRALSAKPSKRILEWQALDDRLRLISPANKVSLPRQPREQRQIE